MRYPQRYPDEARYPRGTLTSVKYIVVTAFDVPLPGAWSEADDRGKHGPRSIRQERWWFVRADDGRPFYEAKWRRVGRQVKRRVGPAWLDPSGDRRLEAAVGSRPDRLVRREASGCADGRADRRARSRVRDRARERERKLRGATLRELAPEWLEYLEREKGAKPSTLRDYGYLLKEPDTPHRRGGGRNPGRIMQTFGDTRLRDVTTSQVATFLRGLDRSGMSARSVNKHRQVLAAMFAYACREDTYALPHNPVSATSKRREMPAAVLDFYEPEEIEALARTAADGAHRGRPVYGLDADELAGARGRTVRTRSFTASPPTPACGSASCSHCAGRTSTSTDAA